ncbi:hypothetical protein KKE19_02245 [Patescibacteria group bacterium]|nr:hypothetical protein [Patescibacteria group bacterium]MBU4274613.1 hypothetical protein [Patescibacteria group bacterium]MBU4367659.1 hypothetical protein [Patescibacteria group bacterium]MBU4461891.1 hypothetical protein [Patescibacteria group bacterium]MCG2699978.1 HTH domain-containing protein [Candidatus Parcubacteria bacterium]
MSKTNYSQTYSSLIKDLPAKTKEVFSRRFGIGQKERETLESIGSSINLTRERVRQIEATGFSHIKNQKKETLDKLFKEFLTYFKNSGNFKREDLVLADLGGDNFQPYILFLLSLGEQFSRVCEKRDFYSFWTILPDGEQTIKKNLSSFVAGLKKDNNLLAKKDFLTNFSSKYNLNTNALLSYLEVSKNIKENNEEKIGLVEWPEINPRGVRDRAFLVFKKEEKPLHFTKVAGLIDKFNYNLPNKKTLPQTVHNELIKDQRFVLVGRGTYALKSWGYNPGTVKDVLINIMKENSGPVAKDKLIERVLSQRLVAKNTVLMNLNDKKYFLKDEQGKYILRKTQTA